MNLYNDCKIEFWLTTNKSVEDLTLTIWFGTSLIIKSKAKQKYLKQLFSLTKNKNIETYTIIFNPIFLKREKELFITFDNYEHFVTTILQKSLFFRYNLNYIFGESEKIHYNEICKLLNIKKFFNEEAKLYEHKYAIISYKETIIF